MRKKQECLTRWDVEDDRTKIESRCYSLKEARAIAMNLKKTTHRHRPILIGRYTTGVDNDWKIVEYL